MPLSAASSAWSSTSIASTCSIRTGASRSASSPGNTLGMSTWLFQGLDARRGRGGVAALPRLASRHRRGDFEVDVALKTVAASGQSLSGIPTSGQGARSDASCRDDRPGVPVGRFFWSGDRARPAMSSHGYRLYVAAVLAAVPGAPAMPGAAAVRRRPAPELALHVNKGLAGAPAEARAAARDTAMNPAVWMPSRLRSSRRRAGAGLLPESRVASRMSQARERARRSPCHGQTAGAGARCGILRLGKRLLRTGLERAFWGPDSPRLAAAKKKYDPEGLFFVDQGVGSEEWSADGFRRLR